MNASAPNFSCAGSHLLLVMKLKPSWRHTGHDCFVVTIAISARIPSTERPAPSASARNARSPHTSRDRERPSAAASPPPSVLDTGATAVTARTSGSRLRRYLQGGQLGGGLLHQVRGQGGVVVGGRQQLTLVVD